MESDQAGTKLILFIYILCMTATSANSISREQENEISKNLHPFFDADYVNIGGMQIPIMKQIPIPEDPFLQTGFLRSLYSKQKENMVRDGYKYNVSSTCNDDFRQLFTSLGDNRTSYRTYAQQSKYAIFC